MQVHVTEIDGPAFLAPALIRDDHSSLTHSEDANILAEFKALMPPEGRVIDYHGDWYGTWLGHLYDMCTYVVTYPTNN